MDRRSSTVSTLSPVILVRLATNCSVLFAWVPRHPDAKNGMPTIIREIFSSWVSFNICDSALCLDIADRGVANVRVGSLMATPILLSPTSSAIIGWFSGFITPLKT